MVAPFGIANRTLMIIILFFTLLFLKTRRSTLLQSRIINADNKNPRLFGNWLFSGNSTECIFPSCFLGNSDQENVFYDILEQTNAFLGDKNKKIKKSKN